MDTTLFNWSTLLKTCSVFLTLSLFAGPLSAQPAAPTGLTATGYDSHIELKWNKNPEPNILGYRIYRQNEGETNFSYVTFTTSDLPYWLDFTGQNSGTRIYRINAVSTGGQVSDYAQPDTAATHTMTDDEFLDMVQAYTFRYFWDFDHPVSGLTRERNTSGDVVTIGGSGFGVMAILVGIERGFITWDEGLQRMLKIVLFLEGADRFHGVFPHWMNGQTGKVVPFSTLDNGGDLVETSFMLEGLLTARAYFGGNSVDEIVLRTKINQIWETVDWNWYRKQNQNVLFWHWSPNNNFAINFQIRGYNEALIVYLLAAASPTYAVPGQLYTLGWAGNNNYVNGNTYYGYKLDVGPALGGPLFFAHYSFMGFDPRNIKDAYANYFKHNRNHTLVNRAYCIANPKGHAGYSDVCWGLTASDDPFVGYLAHEPGGSRDNGTIAPTAALSSMPYTPAESIAALKHFYRDHGDKIWGPMGFYDAFNVGADWYTHSYLAIDQGPIINMIENYRSGLLWNNFMSNPEIQPALDKVGFTPEMTAATAPGGNINWRVFPVPTDGKIISDLDTGHPATVSLRVYDSRNRLIMTQIDHQRLNTDKRTIDLSAYPPGVYFLQLATDNNSWFRKVLLIH